MFGICTQAYAERYDPNKEENLFEMSIEELMNVEVATVSKKGDTAC